MKINKTKLPDILIAGAFLSAGIIFFLNFSSCSNMGFLTAKSWSSVSKNHIGFMELGMIRVEKNADWDSLEAETRRLLPLMLAEKGYGLNKQENPQGNIPGYRIDAVLIEREYMENWKPRRSLSAEIIIRNAGAEENAPLAAGKALLLGNKSLSSSKVLYDLLQLALDRSLQALPKP